MGPFAVFSTLSSIITGELFRVIIYSRDAQGRISIIINHPITKARLPRSYGCVPWSHCCVGAHGALMVLLMVLSWCCSWWGGGERWAAGTLQLSRENVQAARPLPHATKKRKDSPGGQSPKGRHPKGQITTDDPFSHHTLSIAHSRIDHSRPRWGRFNKHIGTSDLSCQSSGEWQDRKEYETTFFIMIDYNSMHALSFRLNKTWKTSTQTDRVDSAVVTSYLTSSSSYRFRPTSSSWSDSTDPRFLQ
ncbi:hypothetical protein F4778DRAFT_192258 [Xylariomycetidae sp. FL2044]|nr:hypothetical protein F4778DRAFT_192258 [Xylariomycetidae sp. FL2044]